MGTEISWLLPAALVVLSAGLVATARRARLDRTRAALPEIAIWVEAHFKSLSVGGTTVYDLS